MRGGGWGEECCTLYNVSAADWRPIFYLLGLRWVLSLNFLVWDGVFEGYLTSSQVHVLWSRLLHLFFLFKSSRFKRLKNITLGVLLWGKRDPIYFLLEIGFIILTVQFLHGVPKLSMGGLWRGRNSKAHWNNLQTSFPGLRGMMINNFNHTLRILTTVATITRWINDVDI